jgi:hypothetical protein
MPRKISTGKYLKASQLTEEGTVHTIMSCEEEPIQSQTGADEMKWVLYLSDDLKPLILNSTNINRLIAACGTDDVDLWAGKRVVVYNDPSISYGGSVTGGCRVRAVKAAKRPTKRGQAKAAPAEGEELSDIPF